MGYLKELVLSGAKPVQIERTLRLLKPVTAPQIRRVVEAFGDTSVGGYYSKSRERMKDRVINVIVRSLTATEADGKVSSPSLVEFERHLARRRVSKFEIKLHADYNFQNMTIRSNGTTVLVRAGALTHENASELIAKASTALGLASQDALPPKKSSASDVAHLTYDAFISHASEDKTTVARPLYEALTDRGYRVWLDQLKLRIGDSLMQSIDDGLRKSRHGIVVLSPNFFKKKKVWTKRELGGLFALETADHKRRVLPVRHSLSSDELAKHSPMLADVVAGSTSGGIDALARALAGAIGASLKARARRAAPTRGT